MIRSMTARALPAVPILMAVLALSACGNSSSDPGSSSSSSTATTSTATDPGVAAKIKRDCLDATKKISDATARSAADHSCDALANNPQLSAALVKARTTCLKAAAKLPVANIQKIAIDTCAKVSTASP
jgi:hypothetical protein